MSKTFGQKEALNEISFSLNRNEEACLVDDINGMGKPSCLPLFGNKRKR